MLPGVGMNAVPGGAFPIPSACAHVLAKLPPPRCFQVSVTRHTHLAVGYAAIVIPCAGN